MKEKKVTGLENNKILSVFGSDTGKLQTDAVVGFFFVDGGTVSHVWRIKCIILGVENVFYK